MPISFRGQFIPGVYQQPKMAPWAVQVARTHYFGVAGESEIRGERGGRNLDFEGMWYFAYESAELLQADIEGLNSQAPINGTIVRTGPITDSFPNCTLMGVTIKQGPLPSTQYGWWAMVDISFRQLGPA
jgi:hypothetical protein